MPKQDFDKLFSELRRPEPSADLLARILQRLRVERRLLVIRQRLWLLSASLIASAVTVFPIFTWVKQDLISSGFLNFLALAVSDFEIVLASWQTFALLLLETLPSLSLALLLALALVFLKSLQSWSKNRQIFLETKQLINA